MQKRNYQAWIEAALMLIVSAAIYLPFIDQFGYYNDDWYSMYAARIAGSQVFHEIYGLDRPGRAYVMIPLYEIFGGNPLYYNILAYVFRVIGVMCLLWLLRLVWQERNIETFLIAFLFLIYPGFLSMPNGIDFQSHLIALCLVFFSTGLNILAVRGKGIKQVLLWAGAVITGWAYLSQMEYYLGFEAARLCLLAVLAWRDNTEWKKRVSQAVYTWLPFSPVPVFYLIWRIFFFSSDRVATDIDLQFATLAAAPLATFYNWIGGFVQSFLNVTLFAWSVPLYQLAFPLDTSSSIRGITLGVVIAVVSLMVLIFLGRTSSSQDETRDNGNWRCEMLIVGVLWAIAGLVIVILANRIVTFPAYSRYGMVSAAGAIMALVACLSFLSEKRLQWAMVFILFFSSAFTQYANGLQHARVSQNMRTFWWQVSWRVPQFEQGTTVIANYPNSGNREESFVWGPANQIYYPFRVNPNKVQAGIYAIFLNHESVIKIQMREGQIYRKRVIVETYNNYRNFVILSQPTPGSCVQIINGKQPEFSHFEADSILIVGQYSEVGHIILDEKLIVPPSFLFGPEPSHGWCYYYEKATLARQRGEWNEVLGVGEQAFSQGLKPQDPIEWMPFLQAYAFGGDIERLGELAPKVTSDPYVSRQACQILGSMENISNDVSEAITSLYCLE